MRETERASRADLIVQLSQRLRPRRSSAGGFVQAAVAAARAGHDVDGRSRTGRSPQQQLPRIDGGSSRPDPTAVAELVADGKTYREIGERIFISRRTVETHVAHIFTKVDVTSKSELAAAYVRHANAPAAKHGSTGA